MFFILKLEDNTMTYYESAIRFLNKNLLENDDQPLREIVQLLREWVSFSIGSLVYFSSISFS
jgi:hypothetical protein